VLIIAVKKLVFLVKAVLLLLIVLLLFPRIASASCAQTRSVTTMDEPVVSSMVTGLRELGEFECAEFRGTIFLDETLPVKVLGIHVSDIAIVQAAEGSVTAFVDLSGLSPEAVIESENSVTIKLPGPALACHEITPEWNIYPRNIPVGSAEDVALLEDAMAEEARSLLCQQALENGLLEEAIAKLKRVATELAATTGYEGQILLEFETAQ